MMVTGSTPIATIAYTIAMIDNSTTSTPIAACVMLDATFKTYITFMSSQSTFKTYVTSTPIPACVTSDATFKTSSQTLERRPRHLPTVSERPFEDSRFIKGGCSGNRV